MNSIGISRISYTTYDYYNAGQNTALHEKLNSKFEYEGKSDSLQPYNKALLGFDRKLEYSIHAETNTIMVKVINTENNSVIREVPPEKILDMIAEIWNIIGAKIDIKV